MLLRLEGRDAGLVEPRRGDRQMARNSKIRTTIKRMFENGELSLTKMMRRMGALWTKTQAAKKSKQQMRVQVEDQQIAGAQQGAGQENLQEDDLALRNVLQSVTDDADPEAPVARQGRDWQAGRGDGRPARGRGAGRGRGGRAAHTARAICPRCGGDYARTYLWYHSQRCAGNQDFAWGEGRGGRGRAARGGRQGGAGAEAQAEAEPDGNVEEDVQEEEENVLREDDLEENVEEDQDEDDEEILEEVEELERTVFAENEDARGRGQKRRTRTAMSVSSQDESVRPSSTRRRTNRPAPQQHQPPNFLDDLDNLLESPQVESTNNDDTISTLGFEVPTAIEGEVRDLQQQSRGEIVFNFTAE